MQYFELSVFLLVFAVFLDDAFSRLQLRVSRSWLDIFYWPCINEGNISLVIFANCVIIRVFLVSFVHSLLRAGVQPTLDPSAEIFMSVQCASAGTWEGELVGVCGVCARCVGWRKAWVGVSSLSCISKLAPSRSGLLAKPGLALIQRQPWPALIQRLASRLSHIYLLRLSRQRGWYLDAANQGITNGHSL